MATSNDIKHAIDKVHRIQDELFDRTPGISREKREQCRNTMKKETEEVISGKKPFSEIKSEYMYDIPESSVKFMIDAIFRTMFEKLYPHLVTNPNEYTRFQAAMVPFFKTIDIGMLATQPKCNAEMLAMIEKYYKPL